MNQATIIDLLTIGMIIAAILMSAVGLHESFRRSDTQVAQPATLPPQSPPPDEAIPFAPGEVLPSEVFSEIVSWQVSDVLSLCHWYDSTWKDGVE